MNAIQFQVSARKYRPQNFDAVVGQHAITTTLRNAVLHQHLAHAYLFCGPRGVGKTTCARILAKTINCEHLLPNADACDTCNSCKSFNQNGSFNIFELDAASNNGVENIRQLLEQVRVSPQGGKYKVFIIDEVHMLSMGAFNAFLKTLEEPPSYVVFILATTEKQKIIPTILSRCQIFDFKRIEEKDMVTYLSTVATQENLNFEPEALQVISQKSEGCMRDALTLLDKISGFSQGNITYKTTIEHLNILDVTFYFDVIRSVQKGDCAALLLAFHEMYKKGFEGDTILGGLSEFLRNVFICKNPESLSILEVLKQFEPDYKTLANELDLSFILSALNLTSEAEIQYKTARNKKLFVELFFIKLSYLPNALDLTQTPATSVDGSKKVFQNAYTMLRPLPLSRYPIPKINPMPVSQKKEVPPTIPSEKVIADTEINKPIIPTLNTPIFAVPSLEAIRERVTAKTQAMLSAQTPSEFTQIELDQLKNDYLAELMEKGQSNTANIIQEIPFVWDMQEAKIYSSVTEYAQKSVAEKWSAHFMLFIKKRIPLADFSFEIQEAIKEHPNTRLNYLSTNEIYNKMVSQNPSVADLKNKLGFDLE